MSSMLVSVLVSLFNITDEIRQYGHYQFNLDRLKENSQILNFVEKSLQVVQKPDKK